MTCRDDGDGRDAVRSTEEALGQASAVCLHAAPFVAHYRVLGVRLDFAANAPELLAHADGAFGPREPPSVSAIGNRVTLTVTLRDAPRRSAEQSVLPRPRFRAAGEVLQIDAGSSCGFADGAAGCGEALIAGDVAADPVYLGSCFVECLGVYLASRRNLAPLHAAAIVPRCPTGRGVEGDHSCILLTGRSGAGKSTLAYACVRAGLGLLAEDVVFVPEASEAAPELRALGMPWRIHLLPDARVRFPELVGCEAARRPCSGDDSKLVVNLRESWPAAPVREARIAGVVLVVRGRIEGMRCPKLTKVDPLEAADALTDLGNALVLDRSPMQRAADRLVSGPIVRLECGPDLTENVGLLQKWISSACA